MTYREFRDNYKYMLKQFPDSSYLFEDEPKNTIELTTINFEKVGNRWKETGRNVYKINFEHYANIIESIPFFRSLGGREIVTKSYTSKGYIPVELHSISPSKTEKTVRTFKF